LSYYLHPDYSLSGWFIQSVCLLQAKGGLTEGFYRGGAPVKK